MEDPSPNPKIKFFAAIKKAILNIKDYKGRSRRSEYFYWLLTVVICSNIIGVIYGLLMELIPVLGIIILCLFLVFVFVVSLPLGFRRLQDVGKNGFFMFLGLIPIIGGIVLLVFLCKDSQKESNKWGESPKYTSSSEESLNVDPIKVD